MLQGTLSYRRPDRVEKHVLSPYDERITVEGGRLTLENRSAEPQEDDRGHQRAGARGAGREHTRDPRRRPRRAAAPLRAAGRGQPRAVDPHAASRCDAQVADYVTSLALSGSETRIGRITIEETGGDRSVMEISEQLE